MLLQLFIAATPATGQERAEETLDFLQKRGVLRFLFILMQRDSSDGSGVTDR